jgi:hypothetical protein
MGTTKTREKQIKSIEKQIKKHSSNPKIVKNLEGKKTGLKEINRKKKT